MRPPTRGTNKEKRSNTNSEPGPCQSQNRRNPQDTIAWIIGTDLISLAAAVYLINDGQVPGPHIHVLGPDTEAPDATSSVLGEKKCDNLQHARFPLHLISGCIAQMLSYTSTTYPPHMSLLDLVMDSGTTSSTTGPADDQDAFFVMKDQHDVKRINHPGAQLRLKERKDLIRVMLDGEESLESASINGCFGSQFFSSELWQLFSGRFALQPWHSAVEFHRLLKKYLGDAQSCRIDHSFHAEYLLSEVVLGPLRGYLEQKGVHFHPRIAVSDLKLLPEAKPSNICMIQGRRGGKGIHIPIRPQDIVIATLGSPLSGLLAGSNGSPPPPISAQAETILNGSWSLWFKLARLSSKFGNPAAFCTNVSESKMQLFTVTLHRGERSMALYLFLRDQIHDGSSLYLPHSNWSICLSLPTHPTFQEQANLTCTIWGYGLTPDQHGNFIQKPMCRCAGQEILAEILPHLGLPSEEILPTAITVPVMAPLVTSPLLKRNRDDRPDIFPRGVGNLALIGQFANIKDETAGCLEYGVRSAQIAACGLMGLRKRLPRVQIHTVAERYGKDSTHGASLYHYVT